MEGVLKGIRVLDLSSVLAGPLAGTFLAECGADVTKVEAPGGDVTRSWKLPGESPGPSSSYYEAANHGKTVVSHNLKTTEGQAWLQDILAHTDVLLQNMKWGDLDTMGLLPDQLSNAFPQLVHVRLVGFEHRPDRLAYDVVVQAESGFMSMNGTPDGPATKMPVAMMDILASHQMRAAVMGGLFHRERTGRGGYAEVSLWGSGLTALANQGTQWLMHGTVPQRMGSTHPNIAPYGDMLTCRDGDVVLAVGSDAQFTSLVQRVGVRRAGRRPSLPHQRRTGEAPRGLGGGIECTGLPGLTCRCAGGVSGTPCACRGRAQRPRGPGQRDGPSLSDRTT